MRVSCLLSVFAPSTTYFAGIWISDVSINRPTVVSGAVGAVNKNVYPSEARERGGCYKGKCTVRTGYSINGEKQNDADLTLKVKILLEIRLSVLLQFFFVIYDFMKKSYDC